MNAARIAIFLPSLNGGGAERVMVTLANAFTQRGYTVDLVLAEAKGPYLQDVSPDVSIVNLKSGRVFRALLPLAQYLRQRQPAAMLVAMTHANIIALLARMLSRKQTRLVLSERSTISVDCGRAQGLGARIIYTLVPIVYPRADCIVAVSQGSATDLVRFATLPSNAVEVIYNPFELKRLHTKAAETSGHCWFEPGQPPVILAIGRLTEQKDFPCLIHAFAKLRKERALHLLILGEGELRIKLEALVEECSLTKEDVQMPGFVANPFAFLARCSVFVLSSRWEGLPGVLIEAMACGSPVVSTDCPSGPREILDNGRWGRLVPVGDVDAMAKAIDNVLSTPKAQLPDVRRRAGDFEQGKAVDAYLKALGLPPKELHMLTMSEK